MASRIENRLRRDTGQPEQLYEYLKAYLMLGDPEHLDKPFLQEFADFEWRSADGVAAGTGASLSRHFQALLAQDGTLRPVALDAALIAQARTTIRRASIAQIIYGRLKRRFADDTARAVRLDVAAGIGADKLLRRPSGAPLSTPVPALYSKPVFREATTTGPRPWSRNTPPTAGSGARPGCCRPTRPGWPRRSSTSTSAST